MFTGVYWQLEHDGKCTRLYRCRIHLNKIETRVGLEANVSLSYDTTETLHLHYIHIGPSLSLRVKF